MLLLSSRLINKTFENLYKIIKSSSKKMSSELRKTFARFNTTRFEKYVENLSNLTTTVNLYKLWQTLWGAYNFSVEYFAGNKIIKKDSLDVSSEIAKIFPVSMINLVFELRKIL